MVVGEPWHSTVPLLGVCQHNNVSYVGYTESYSAGWLDHLCARSETFNTEPGYIQLFFATIQCHDESLKFRDVL